MPNLSEGLIQQGEIQGSINSTAKYISNMINHGISEKDAFELLNVDDIIKQAVLEKLKEEQNI